LHVTKLVDFIARIPEHLASHFYDVFTNFYTFSKFAVLSYSTFCIFNPVTLVPFNWGCLGGCTEQGRGKALRFPVRESPEVGAR